LAGTALAAMPTTPNAATAINERIVYSFAKEQQRLRVELSDFPRPRPVRGCGTTAIVAALSLMLGEVTHKRKIPERPVNPNSRTQFELLPVMTGETPVLAAAQRASEFRAVNPLLLPQFNHII
jgi:hypothetical protein